MPKFNDTTIYGDITIQGDARVKGNTVLHTGNFNATEYPEFIGYTGSKGDSGGIGPIGYTGSKGDTGGIGPRGYTGSKGDTGGIGPIGYTGSKGDTGGIGPIGYTGSASTVQGPIGYTGSASTVQGPIGYTGSRGADGGSGGTGPRGYTGSASTVQGPIGYTGSASTVQGPPGTAATVSVGTTTTGAAGTSASVTQTGDAQARTFNFTIPKGDKGDPGGQGPKGVPGDPGTAATVTVGTTTTSSPGGNATVTQSGTAQNRIFDFTIPRGEQGPKGDQGENGTSFSITNIVDFASDLPTAGPSYLGQAWQTSDLDIYLCLLYYGNYEWVPQGKIQGPKGDKGDTGNTGPKGDKGEDGLTTKISLNGTTYTQLGGTITLPNYPSVYVLTKSKIDTVLVGTGTSSIALGAAAVSSGLHSTALGYNVSASQNYSTAIGQLASASGIQSTALGYNASASQNYSTALGPNANAEGASSTALGSVAKALGERSTALGAPASASGIQSTALGYNTSASENYSTALGAVANAAGESSTALGRNASASGIQSTALGYNTFASTMASTALGAGASAEGSGSTALGTSAITGTSSNLIQLGSAGSLATLRSKVSLTTTSDIRDKTDIIEVSKALDFIKDLNPITYVSNDRENYISEEQKETETYKNYLMVEDYDKQSHSQGTKKGKRRRVGLSAQEVREKLIEHYGSDNYANVVNDNFVEFEERELDIPEGLENKLTMSYETLVPFLIKAIQEQQEQIEELKKK